MTPLESFWNREKNSPQELNKFGPMGKVQNTRKFRVSGKPAESLGIGLREGYVQRVELISDRDGNKSVNLAEKILYSKGRESEKKTSKILMAHRRLRELEIPTYVTLRTSRTRTKWYKRENLRLYASDLTQGGKFEVASPLDWVQDEKQGRKGKYTESKKIFHLSNPQEVSRELEDIFVKCVENGVRIDVYDVLFLVVEKATNRGSIILGDLYEITIFDAALRDKEVDDSISDNSWVSFRQFVGLMNIHLDQESQLTFDGN